MRRDSQIALPGFPDQIGAERAVRLLRHQFESRLGVDAARGEQNALRPQRHALVAGLLGKTHAFLDQALSEPQPARLWIDDQQAQLRDRVGLAALRRDGDQALAAGARRAPLLEQAVVAEAPQDAAEITVIEIEIGGKLARRDLVAMRELIEDARLRERESRVDQAFLQQAELA